MNLVGRFDLISEPYPRKKQESSHYPQFMFGGEEVIWLSFIIMAIGNSFHRMGPSFERSRFGFPLVLLGFFSLILLPDDLTEIGIELHDSIIQSTLIFFPFALGSAIILSNSQTYGEERISGQVIGWVLVIGSWMSLFSEKSTFSLLGFARGALATLGLIASLISIIILTYLTERSSGLKEESEPLSNHEEALVRAILDRRLGGG